MSVAVVVLPFPIVLTDVFQIYINIKATHEKALRTQMKKMKDAGRRMSKATSYDTASEARSEKNTLLTEMYKVSHCGCNECDWL